MPRGFRTDHEVLGETEATADLVLGAPALLGIFFAAALLCAVCFGFGYSSGHTPRVTPLVESDETASAAQAPPVPQPSPSTLDRTAPDAAEDTPDTNAAPSPSTSAGGAAGTEPGFPPAQESATSASKPAPGMRYASPDTPPGGATPAEMQDLPAAGGTTASRSLSPVPAPAVSRLPAPEAPGSTATTANPPARAVVERPAELAPAGSDAPELSLMVQIAAVSHAADAETLASALRHDGFAAIVRTTTGDPFFHVQIGPFSSLQSAKTMRAKLAGSGYNAFIRP